MLINGPGVKSLTSCDMLKTSGDSSPCRDLHLMRFTVFRGDLLSRSLMSPSSVTSCFSCMSEFSVIFFGKVHRVLTVTLKRCHQRLLVGHASLRQPTPLRTLYCHLMCGFLSCTHRFMSYVIRRDQTRNVDSSHVSDTVNSASHPKACEASRFLERSPPPCGDAAAALLVLMKSNLAMLWDSSVFRC